jgi:4'-phosphopantetheinyl transferase
MSTGSGGRDRRLGDGAIAGRAAEVIEVVELALPRRRADRRRAAAEGLRAELARRLGGDATPVVLERSPGGKPRLAGAAPPVHFSLAHSRERALVAVSLGPPVGVDLEAVDPRRPVEPLATRWFTEAEREQVLCAGPPGARVAAFYRLWVAKEACVKATGEGLAALRQFSVGEDGLVHWSAPRLGSALWKVAPLPVGEGWVAAVAAPGRDWRAALIGVRAE